MHGGSAPALCAAAALPSAVPILQAARLVRACLDALAMHAHEFSSELSSPRPVAIASLLPHSVALPLLEVCLQFTKKESWQQAGIGNTSSAASDASADAVAFILSRLVAPRGGLFECIAAVIAVGCALPPPSHAQRSVPFAETLCTSLLVHYIALRSKISGFLISHTVITTCNSSNSSQAASLFSVPMISRRCPSLAPVMPRLWILAVTGTDTTSTPTMTSQNTGALTAAAIVGNIVEGAPAALYSSSALKAMDQSPHSAGLACVQLIMALMPSIPLQMLLPGQSTGVNSSVGGDDEDDDGTESDDDEDDMDFVVRVPRGGNAALRKVLMHLGASGERESSGRVAMAMAIDSDDIGVAMATSTSFISNQLSGIVQGEFLSAICKAAFPHNTTTTTTRANTSERTPATDAGALTVCAFLLQLTQLPGQRSKVLLNLALAADFPARFWFSFLQLAHATGQWAAMAAVTAAAAASSSSSSTSISSPLFVLSDPGWMLPLWIFSDTTVSAIQVLGDDGLYTAGRPVPLPQLYTPMGSTGSTSSTYVLSLLRSTLFHVLWQETRPSPNGWNLAAATLRARFARAAGHLLGQLHERNGRRPFAPPQAFYADNLPIERFHAEVSAGIALGGGMMDVEGGGGGGAEGEGGGGVLSVQPTSTQGGRAWALLSRAPCLVPFMERVKVFQRLVQSEREKYRRENEGMFGGGGGGWFSFPQHPHHQPPQFVTVKRGQVLSDSYSALASSSPEQLRGRVRIGFVSDLGIEEAGIDGGGVFKEFLENVVKEGFNPENGLFCQTTDKRLYPNPQVGMVVPDGLRVLEFLGRMVGKALWEGILLELPLAPFFLKKVRGNALCDVDDLPTLDPQLARSLASLKTSSHSTPDPMGAESADEINVEDLGLTFSLTVSVMGRPVEVDLVPNGRNIPVTSSNAAYFVHQVADYKLNRQLNAPVAAFVRGLRAMVPRRWIEMFNDQELQELIGGADANIDIDDMRRHVKYAGGYSDDHPVIQALFAVLKTFTPTQRANFLRFVTSCPRPPLLGFAYLEPPLCIQQAVGDSGDEGGGGGGRGGGVTRLPTAATCANLLKLPPYRGGVEELREKLLYAIESGSGFELS